MQVQEYGGLDGWARGPTASQVERLVREFRRANPERENNRAIVQRSLRYLTTLWMTFFESEIDLHELPSEGPELLHLATLLVEYLLTVNTERTT